MSHQAVRSPRIKMNCDTFAPSKSAPVFRIWCEMAKEKTRQNAYMEVIMVVEVRLQNEENRLRGRPRLL